MLHYLAQRLVTSCLLILGLLTVVFFLIQAVPGDPADWYTSDGMAEADRDLIRQRLGLDRPVWEQYWRWLRGVLLAGDFGNSFRLHRPVRDLFAESIPNTLLLTVSAYVLHLLLAICGGLVIARYRGRIAARLTTLGGLIVYSLPTFWLSLMLILLFGRYLGWLPISGMESTDAEFMPWYLRLLDRLWHMVLPVTVLGVGSAMGTTRYLSNTLADVLNQDYILAVRSRGLPEKIVLWRHALRNALLPIITLMGLSLPFLLGGAVIVEVVFAWPGLGRVTVNAIWARDYPVIMAATALSATMVVTGSFLADVLYYWVDPRVRQPGAKLS